MAIGSIVEDIVAMLSKGSPLDDIEVGGLEGASTRISSCCHSLVSEPYISWRDDAFQGEQGEQGMSYAQHQRTSDAQSQNMSSTGVSQPLWLLLLPSPPRKVTASTIKSLYASTISQVLQKAADVSSAFSSVTILDIAIPCDESIALESFHYSDLQNLLGQLYRLICLLCAENSIDVQYGNDVDVRVLLFKDPDNEARLKDRVPALVDDPSTGPIVSLRRLACCGRPWQRVCSMDDAEGEILLQLFLRLRNETFDNSRGKIVVERFASKRSSPASENATASATHDQVTRAHHDAVAVGGTFDHLHAGHKLLLSMTALVLNTNIQPGVEVERSLTVGITGDKLLENKKYREHLQDWHQRQAAVQSFLLAFLIVDQPLQNPSSSKAEKNEGSHERTVTNILPLGLTIEYVEIFDAFGPTITKESISALVLSGETRAGGKAVNEKRAAKQWTALDIFEVDVLDSATVDAATSDHARDDFQNKLSSTEIRRRLAKRLTG
ncbi:MAG: hypothetical protein Q9171_007304 [Xanthocarpia ochracea]